MQPAEKALQNIWQAMVVRKATAILLTFDEDDFQKLVLNENGDIHDPWRRKGKERNGKGRETKGKERRGREGKGRREGKGKERKGKEGKEGKKRKGKKGKGKKGQDREGKERKGRQRKGREGKERKGKEEKKAKGRERKGKEGRFGGVAWMVHGSPAAKESLMSTSVGSWDPLAESAYISESLLSRISEDKEEHQ
eukprot:Skav223167  [mRNA]  locus=scaffold3747:112178:113360:+ [translate_table: standard]